MPSNRAIFAVPGGRTSMNSVGTNALIKKGAKLVRNVDDIIGELTPLLKGLLSSGPDKADRKGHGIVNDLGRLEINNEEKAICNVLGSEPRHVDIISRETGIASQKLSGILLDLELKGVIMQTEGKRLFIL